VAADADCAALARVTDSFEGDPAGGWAAQPASAASAIRHRVLIKDSRGWKFGE
jgi:hypothetical protein